MRPDRVYRGAIELGIFNNAWIVAGPQFIEDGLVRFVRVALLQF
jgi:hypothetical protein